MSIAQALALLVGAWLASPGSGQAQVLFSEDFEDGAPDWTATGKPEVMWHVAAPGECGAVTHMASYNRSPKACDYVTGGQNSGAFLSPVFTIQGDYSIVVQFDYRRDTDEGGPCVEVVSEANGRAVTVIGCSCCGDPFTSYEISRAAGALPIPESWSGKKVRLRFSHKADSDGNTGFGCMVDNVRVIASGPPEVLYTEDFQGSTDGWTMTTEGAFYAGPSLWHVSTPGECGAERRMAAYNHAPASCDYDTGNFPNEGRLKSPLIRLRGAPPFTVEFESLKDMDASGDAAWLHAVDSEIDRMISAGPFPDTATVQPQFLTIDPPGIWSFWSGRQARLEFAASADPLGNASLGWMIGKIRVTNAGALPPVPFITSVQPARAPSGTSTTIVLQGENFADATSVTIGSDSAKFTVDSDTQITAVLGPTTATGPVDVLVSNAAESGRLVGGFTLLAPVAKDEIRR